MGQEGGLATSSILRLKDTKHLFRIDVSVLQAAPTETPRRRVVRRAPFISMLPKIMHRMWIFVEHL